MMNQLALISAELQPASDGLSLLTLWVILKRRRFLILATTLLLLAAAIAASVLSAREYQAAGEIHVQKDSSAAQGFDSLMSTHQRPSLKFNLPNQVLTSIHVEAPLLDSAEST